MTAIATALVTAACGSSSPTSAQPAASGSTATHHPMEHSTSPATTSALIGSDCGMIPESGMGSMHSMSMEPVVTAASHNPLLTTFAADAGQAGLTAELNSMRSFTVFAPANSAFAKLPAATMTMLHSSAELAKTLKFHVVSGRVTPAQIARGVTVTTAEGGQLKLSKMGAVYEVDNANVLCGNVQTANATVYIISKVLTPMH